MSKKARLIYNPFAGKEEIRRRLSDILERLEKIGFETSCHATQGKGNAEKEAHRAVQEGYDAVFVAGGDGTLHDVVNGMAPYDAPPPLGILPLGTSNNFARAIHLPKDYRDVLQVIANGEVQQVDVGRMNGRYFIHICGGGALTDVSYDVPPRLKALLGQMAYMVQGIEKLPRLKPIRLNIEITGRSREKAGENGVLERVKDVLEEEVMLFLVANTGVVGGFEALVPGTDVTDGYLDVLVVKKANLPHLLWLAQLATRGAHRDRDEVLLFQAKKIRITSPDQVPVNLDGELGGQLPADIEVVPRRLPIFWPRG